MLSRVPPRPGVAGVRIRQKKHKAIKGDDVISFFQQLSTLLTANTPLMRALQVAGAQSESEKLVVVLRQLASDVASGSSLNEAMLKNPKLFENQWVEMIKAGERSGRLAETIEELTEYIKTRRAIRGKVVSAMIYPLILRRQHLVDIREAASNRLAGHVADSIANAEAVRAFAREPHEAMMHARNVNDFGAKTLRSWDYQNLRVDTLTSPMYVLTNTLGLIIALASSRGTGAAKTWKTGCRLRWRSGLAMAATCANGTSWCAAAAAATSRTSRSASRQVGS